MRSFFAFLLGVAAVSAAQAQDAQPVADLRSLLQQNWVASAQPEQSPADAWQLSPEEQARLRQQLAEFSSKKTLAQDEAAAAESRMETQEPSRP